MSDITQREHLFRMVETPAPGEPEQIWPIVVLGVLIVVGILSLIVAHLVRAA